MVITLNNGRTVTKSFDEWIDMSDYELKLFMDSEYGEEINNPFYQSQLFDNSKSDQDDDPDED